MRNVMKRNLRKLIKTIFVVLATLIALWAGYERDESNAKDDAGIELLSNTKSGYIFPKAINERLKST